MPRRLCPHGRCELDTSFCSNDSLGVLNCTVPPLRVESSILKKTPFLQTTLAASIHS